MIVLTQEEADELLQMLKKCIDMSVELPTCGYRKDYEAVAVVQKNERFIISVNRKNSMTDKVSYLARYKKDNTILMRLDVAPTSPHVNPELLGGDKITGTHLHLYREGFETKFAIPFEPQNPNLEKTFYEFLDKFNVKEKPIIAEQTKITEE